MYTKFQKIAMATAIGFAIMGFIGFFVKLIHIPINNIIVSRSFVITALLNSFIGLIAIVCLWVWLLENRNFCACVKPYELFPWCPMNSSSAAAFEAVKASLCRVQQALSPLESALLILSIWELPLGVQIPAFGATKCDPGDCAQRLGIRPLNSEMRPKAPSLAVRTSEH
ncbi:hypothetical protein CB1_001232017 [Camelus ferus]|nr:hypothetical protein CB1_001232017 [Camelus ferus]